MPSTIPIGDPSNWAACQDRCRSSASTARAAAAIWSAGSKASRSSSAVSAGTWRGAMALGDIGERVAACDGLAAPGLDQAMGLASAEMRDHGRRQPLGVDQPAGRLEIARHGGGVDLEALDGIENRQGRGMGMAEELGQQRPFRMPGPGRPLMLLRQAGEERADEMRRAGGRGDGEEWSSPDCAYGAWRWSRPCRRPPARRARPPPSAWRG